jgi:hypothetical protein
MGEIIIHNVLQREPGYFYYVDKEGNLCRAKMGRKRRVIE